MIRRLIHQPFVLAAALLLSSTTTGWAAAEEHGSGFKTDLPFWGIVAFVGFLIALKKLGWNSLTSGMQQREATEKQLIADAESLRTATAEQLRQNRGKMEALDELVRQTLAEAQRDADHTRSDMQRVADQERNVIRQRAESEIDRVKNQSLSEVFAAAADRIATEAEARIRGSLTPDAQQKLIDAAVGEFAAQKA
ncbi:MAG: hypothetical protein ACK5Q5_08400 [Planctomycetaceae bacterium]